MPACRPTARGTEILLKEKSQCSQSCARAASNIASPPETRSSSRSSTANAGDKITLGDVLLAGDGSDLKSTDGLTVAAEIVAQAKGDKVTVFKKRRRHNYRRKKGHRQQHTILKIVAIGDQKAQKKAAPKAEGSAEGRCTVPKAAAAPEGAARPAPRRTRAKDQKAAAPKTAAKPAKAKANPGRQKMLHPLRRSQEGHRRPSNQTFRYSGSYSSWHIRKQAARPATDATARASASA